MYFYTNPVAEHKLLSAFSPSGEQCWRWVEFALQIPFFILSVTVEDDECSIGRNLLFGSLEDLLGAISGMGENCTIENAGILSPGYMNASDCYKLGNIKKIWVHSDKQSELYELDDGSKLYYSAFGDDRPSEGDAEKDMDLVLSL